MHKRPSMSLGLGAACGKKFPDRSRKTDSLYSNYNSSITINNKSIDLLA